MILKEMLIEAAQKALINAYAPYSNYRVGASVLAGGKIYTGANVENAAYGLTICAEQAAIAAAISDGQREIEGVAVVTAQGEASPCGACRQIMREFGLDIPIFSQGADGAIKETSLLDLLPHSFGPSFLRR
ncbi:MAG: cytidine deaminase [bacterium]|nr:cytidine deaminase [bacterium]